MANQFLSLSMFLMLLSFFIVLNSMSTFEKEVAVPAVLNSLSMAFSKQENKLIKEYILSLLVVVLDDKHKANIESIESQYFAI